VRQLEAELVRANQLFEKRILARQEAERALMRLETARRRAQALEHRESAARSERNTVLTGKH